MAFKLPDLDYSYDSLEPYIDSKTMEIHYGKHHAGYTANLNNAIQGTEMENHSINQILENLDMNNSALRNNGGGFFNHCLYWEIMGPNCGGTPSGDLLNSIAIILGVVIIYFLNWKWIDPIFTFILCFFMIYWGIDLAKKIFKTKNQIAF